MNAWMPWMLPVVAGAALGDLCPGSPGGPVVEGPGAVNCGCTAIAGGTRTTYSVAGDTVLRWTDFHLGAGDELIFDFANADDSVANLLLGSTHRIDGLVQSNGRVGFFAQGDLSVSGRVEAREVTLSALDLQDPAAFLDGGDFAMQGDVLRQLAVTGEVEATAGDVRLAGDLVRVSGDAGLQADGAVRIGAGQQVAMAASGQRRVSATGGVGVLLHLGDTRGAELELVASGELANAGRLEAAAGFGKVYLEVGNGGTILNEGTGVIIGQPVITGNFDSDGVILGPDADDTLPVVNSSVVRIPTVKRPDGSVAAKARTVETTAAASASADALRKPVKREKRIARQSKSLVRRQSFFGMRGGTREEQRR